MKLVRLGFLCAVTCVGAEEVMPWRNPDLPVHERVTDLMERMTIEEQVSQIEMNSPAIERLGIPAYSWWGESVHGVARAGKATVFPQAIALAATWDVHLMHRVAIAISDEARAKHSENPVGQYRGLTFFAPCVNLIRDPRWGRAQEAYSEDPHLTAAMGIAYVRGMQGDDPHYLKTAALLKHFAVHSQETGRFETCFDASARDLWEYYLRGFEAGIVQAGARGVMMALNGVNGLPATMHPWLMQDVLRDTWNLRGAIVTDYGATLNLVRHYKLVETDEAAVQAALTAGIDVLCQPQSIFTNILNAVTSGLVTTQQLQRALSNALTTRFELGMFDPPERVWYAQYPPEVIGAAAHVALALESSRASIVLLKNDKVPHRAAPAPMLPLARERLESVAVIGPFGEHVDLGNYTGAPAQPPVSIADGLRQRLPPHVVVRGVRWFDLDQRLQQIERNKKLEDADRQKHIERAHQDHEQALRDAEHAAANSDRVVLCLGLGAAVENEFRDRLDLDLPKAQQEFLKKIVGLNPTTVLVLTGGSAISVNWANQHVPAILQAWYAGEQGGLAVADVLLGDYNPAGRLPLTFYTGIDQLPPLEDYQLAKGRTYLYLPQPPLYPFGHGLSYTQFAYRNLRIEPAVVTHRNTVTVAVEVANVGDRAGEEVVQLYVRDVAASVPVPRQQLRGFERISLARGAHQVVRFTVNAWELGYWDQARGGFVVEPGAFEVRVGASSEDIRLRGQFEVRE